MNRLLRALASTVIVVAAVAAAGGPALAHTELTDVSPAADTVVAEGTVVTLTFSVTVLDIGAEAVVTDASGTATAAQVAFPSPNSVAITLPAVAEGALTLAWRVVADDGHPVEGVLTYVAAAPVPPAPSPSPSDDASTPSVTDSPTSSPIPAASASADPGDDGAGTSEGVPIAVWFAVAAAILASLAVALAARKK